MTDKLADAARKLIDRWETPSWKDVPATGEFINSLRNALTAHEAAKAATPDDVREAVVRISARFDDEGLCYSDVKQFTQDWNAVKDFVAANVIDWDCLQKISDEMPANKQSGQLEMWIHENRSAALRQGVTLPREVVDCLRKTAHMLEKLEYETRMFLPDVDDHTKRGAAIRDGVNVNRIKTLQLRCAEAVEQADKAIYLLDQHARGG